MNRFLRSSLFATCLGLAAPVLAGAVFSQPFVDAYPSKTANKAMFAVWSSTDSYVTPATQVNVLFPPDIAVPASLSLSPCACVFLRHTKDASGTWAGTEVTVTAGVTNATANYVGVALPQALYPGKFYIRFDSTAGFYTSSTPGASTVAMSDPSGNTTLSKSFYTRNALCVTCTGMALITGTVKTTAGVAIPAAFVFASTFSGNFLPISIAARREWVSPMSTSNNAYSAGSAGDGSYTLTVKPGTYYLRAEAWRHKGGVATTSSQDIGSPITVSEDSTVIQNFSLAPVP